MFSDFTEPLHQAVNYRKWVNPAWGTDTDNVMQISLQATTKSGSCSPSHSSALEDRWRKAGEGMKSQKDSTWCILLSRSTSSHIYPSSLIKMFKTEKKPKLTLLSRNLDMVISLIYLQPKKSSQHCITEACWTTDNLIPHKQQVNKTRASILFSIGSTEPSLHYPFHFTMLLSSHQAALF